MAKGADPARHDEGCFIAEATPRRRAWTLRGPFCDGWPINHVVGDPESGAIYAGGGNGWVGHDVWKSTDLGATWTQSGEGLAYEEKEASEPLQAVWSLAPRNGSLYAGVKPAGLFRSDDGGKTWQHIEGLQKHPTRPQWRGGGAGLILHSIALDPDDDGPDLGRHVGGRRLPFRRRRQDLGAAQQRHARRLHARGPALSGVRAVRALPCERAPGPTRLYQQNHCGMYRSDDGGKTWQSIEAGLPTTFGFPAAAHPRDAGDALSDAAHRRLDALPARRQGRGLAHARRRRELAGARKGLPQRRLFRGASPSHGDRPARPGRRLFRHQHRLGLRQCRRRRDRGARSRSTCPPSSRWRRSSSTPRSADSAKIFLAPPLRPDLFRAQPPCA